MIKWKNVIAAGMILSLGALLLMGCGKKDAVADNDDDWVVVGKDSEEPAPATESGTEVVSEDTTGRYREQFCFFRDGKVQLHICKRSGSMVDRTHCE